MSVTVKTNRAAWESAVERAADKAAEALAVQMMNDSLDKIPRQEGTLRDSGRVEKSRTGVRLRRIRRAKMQRSRSARRPCIFLKSFSAGKTPRRFWLATKIATPKCWRILRRLSSRLSNRSLTRRQRLARINTARSWSVGRRRSRRNEALRRSAVQRRV